MHAHGQEVITVYFEKIIPKFRFKGGKRIIVTKAVG